MTVKKARITETLLIKDQDTLAFSITPLLAAAVYTTGTISVKNYDKIVGTCFADQVGTLHAEFSSDGTNWDGIESYTYTASLQLALNIDTSSLYMRLRFVNGGVNQGAFRIYMIGKR